MGRTNEKPTKEKLRVIEMEGGGRSKGGSY